MHLFPYPNSTLSQVYHRLNANLVGNVAKAIQKIDQALRLRPSDPEAVYQKGVLLIHSNDIKTAVEYFIKACALKPESPMFHNAKGLALLRLE